MTLVEEQAARIAALEAEVIACAQLATQLRSDDKPESPWRISPALMTPPPRDSPAVRAVRDVRAAVMVRLDAQMRRLYAAGARELAWQRQPSRSRERIVDQNDPRGPWIAVTIETIDGQLIWRVFEEADEG